MAKRKNLPIALPQDEPDFPRGGGSELSHAEIQDARTQAEADYDSERKSAKKRSASRDFAKVGDLDTFFSGGVAGKLPQSVEILRYKSLSIGMKIWGIIAEVGNKDIIVSLPGGLRGFVRADQASDLLAEAMGSSDKETDLRGHDINDKTVTCMVDNGMDEGTKHYLSLKELFSVGQLVACIIIKLDRTKGKGDKKPSKRIELSLKLGTLHNGLTIDSIHEGLVIWGYVISVEDHGYLLSFGVPAISGFLLNIDYGDGGRALKLKRGQLLQCAVASIDKKRGMVMLKGESGLVSSSVVKDFEGLTLDLLVPGTLVNARVRAILKNGLLLSFLTYFTGTVNIFHLDNPLLVLNRSESYSENQHLKARILYVDAISKSIGLTLNSHLVQNLPPVVDVEVGEVVENAIVCRLDPTVGLLLKIPSKRSLNAGYVHISHASDEHVEKLEKKFKEGNLVRGRVIGLRWMDGLASVTLKDSQVKQLLFGYTDVKPGMKVLGEVIAVEPFGAFVKLADGLKALCPLQHMSEYQRAKASAKFKIGAKLKFRVLVCNDQTKKITLTHKKAMILSGLTPITSYEDAVEGLVTHGWISGIEDYGCFVCFYNDVKGLAHRTELGLDPGAKAESCFYLGQVVKCRVLRADPTSRKISLSFIMFPKSLLESDKGELGLEAEVSTGAIVPGVIAHMTERSIILDIPLPKGFTRAVMHIEHLSDTPCHIEQLKSVLSPGYRFDRLLVLERDRQRLVVSAKYSILQSSDSLPSEVSQLHPQSVIPGYIVSITGAGCFVRFVGGLTGLASVSQISDGFVHDPSQHFSVGHSVRAHVLEVNEVSGRFSLSLKQSRCYSTDASLIQGYFLEEDKIADLHSKAAGGSELDWPQNIIVGTFVEGEIQDIKDYGVIVNLKDHKDIVGFITHYQSNNVEVGKHVKARVLDVVKVDGIVDLTLRPELLESEKALESLKGKHSRKRKLAALDIHQKVQAVVELVKDEYLVLSLPDNGNLIGFASTRDFNLPMLDPHKLYTVGQRLEATVQVLPENSMVGRLLLLLTRFSDPSAMSSSKRVCKETTKYEPGSLVEGEIIGVQPLEVHLRVGKNLHGRIHITEVKDEYEGENPLDDFFVGQKVRTKILERPRLNHDGRKHKFLELSTRPSEMLGDGQVPSWAVMATLTVDQIVTGYVKEVNDEWAWLLVSAHVKGRLFVLDSSSDPVHLKSFKERFQIGQAVRCRVSKVDYEKGLLDLSLRGLKEDDNTKAVHDGQQEQIDVQIKKGDILGGRVAKVFSGVGGLSVQIGSNLFGRVHITHLHDFWIDNPLKSFQEGQFVRCCVLDISKNVKGNIQVDLSLRHSLGGTVPMEAGEDMEVSGMPGPSIVETIENLRAGMEVHGFIKSVSKKGCFVTLSRHVDARIFISNLSEKFIEDPVGVFPPGKLVKGRILSFETLSGRVDMTLKSSTKLDAKSEKKCKFEDLHVGDVISGAIRRVASFGLFIEIDQSDIVGMCHISEISDIYIKTLETHFKVGEKVRVKVLKIEESKQRVFLGMKEFYFKDLEQDASVKAREDIQSVFDNDQTSSPTSHLDTLIDAVADIDDRDTDVPCSSGGTIQPEDALSSVPPLDVDFDNDAVLPDEGNEDDNLTPKGIVEEASKLSKRAKKRQKEERETVIRAAEKKRLEGDQVPESVDDFEKLVHASPNSSFVWIKYMAFMLSLADADKARSIAERALQTISFREEGEKLNVWVAYLNLENVYGNPPKEAILQLFQRALQYCDPKKIYLALFGICERSEQYDMSDELLKTMSRKFKSSAKVWLRQIQYLLKRGMPDAAHKSLDRALLSLPRHKHIKVISQAAILEFKIGSAERARAMFEGILRNYPRRTDLWSVYLDQEICLGDAAFVRALFERATCLELPPRKIKSLFKKYLDYEKSQQDEERIRHVKEKAMEYAETKLG